MTTLGTTGYTMNNVFVLYDRATDSVWYPLKDEGFDAVAGSVKGSKLEFVEKPTPMRLEEWAKAHPDTKVLLPPPLPERLRRQAEQRQRAMGVVLGTWVMTTDFEKSGQALVTLEFVDGRFVGTWESDGQRFELSDLSFDGRELEFERKTPTGGVLEYTGRLRGKNLAGVLSTTRGEFQCNGRRAKTPDE